MAQKLSDIFLQPHSSEHSGRGMPKIIDYCGTGNLSVNEKSVCGTIPYDRLVYHEQPNEKVVVPKVPVDAQVDDENAYDSKKNAQVNDKNAYENAYDLVKNEYDNK